VRSEAQFRRHWQSQWHTSVRTKYERQTVEASMQFDLRLPSKVVFGWGRRKEIGKLTAPLAGRAWVVSGSRTLDKAGVIDELTAALKTVGVEPLRLETLTREPEVADVDAAVDHVKQRLGSRDCIVAIGGGAALDLGKAISGLAPQPSQASVKDYLEGVGRGLQIERPPLPMIAVPTTAGTGTEATKNAVISCFDPPFKKSLRDERLVPQVVLIDPELTVSNPKTVTAYSGMDAITQLIESLVTKKTNPVTQALCMDGLRAAIPALPIAVENPTDRPAREAMAYAAWISGVTLANAGLGLAHGVAAALGVHCKVAHGLACAVMLPAAMRVNLAQCEDQFAEVGDLFGDSHAASTHEAAQHAIDGIVALGLRIGIPSRLRDLGVAQNQLAALVPASRGNSMSGNPVDLSDDQLGELLASLW
jgi:alcohol dehydrogenase class IV